MGEKTKPNKSSALGQNPKIRRQRLAHFHLSPHVMSVFSVKACILPCLEVSSEYVDKKTPTIIFHIGNYSGPLQIIM
jgi:hypothetical protein